VGPVADVPHHLVAEVGGVHRDVGRPGQAETGEPGQGVIQQRDVADGAEGLGERRGEGPQALALTGSEHDAGDHGWPRS
jgi:hypothetical protein